MLGVLGPGHNLCYYLGQDTDPRGINAGNKQDQSEFSISCQSANEMTDIGKLDYELKPAVCFEDNRANTIARGE